MNITIKQACILWDNLRDAMEGKASHGYESEIYAYTLMPSIPSLDISTIDHKHDYAIAAKSLVDVIDMFLDVYPNVTAFIDGVNYKFWFDQEKFNFNHRVKVEIKNATLHH